MSRRGSVFKKLKNKAALISSIPALVVLVGFSIPLTREVIVGPSDPFFFMPLLGILVAENPNTPEYILRELANKPWDELSGYINGLTQNPNLPKDLLEKLSADRAKASRDYLNRRFHRK